MSFIKITFLISLILSTGIFSQKSMAQDADEEKEIQGVEAELEKNFPARARLEPATSPLLKKKQDALEINKLNEDKYQSQTVIIQKNYMPKTSRFDLNGGVTLFPSDVFFKTFGAQLRGGYHFSETWGAELSAIYLISSKSDELKNLESKQSVTASNLANLESFVGANIYFSNMYGKYALSDRKIFPFEIYQTVGIGQVKTNKSSSPAITAGFGQLLSLSRNDAVRFDLSLLFYQTETVNGDKQQSNSLLVTVSYDALFPSVGKRW